MFTDVTNELVNEATNDMVDTITEAAESAGLDVIPMEPEDALDIATTVVNNADKWHFDWTSGLITAGIIFGGKLIVKHGIPAAKKVFGFFKNKKKDEVEIMFENDDDDVDDIPDVEDVEIIPENNEDKSSDAPAGNRAQRRNNK